MHKDRVCSVISIGSHVLDSLLFDDINIIDDFPEKKNQGKYYPI